MKFSKKMKYNEKVCHAQELGSHFQGQGHSQGSEVKSCLCNKTTQANFLKFYRKVNFNQK